MLRMVTMMMMRVMTNYGFGNEERVTVCLVEDGPAQLLETSPFVQEGTIGSFCCAFRNLACTDALCMSPVSRVILNWSAKLGSDLTKGENFEDLRILKLWSLLYLAYACHELMSHVWLRGYGSMGVGSNSIVCGYT
jgi:hypothetical protein